MSFGLIFITHKDKKVSWSSVEKSVLSSYPTYQTSGVVSNFFDKIQTIGFVENSITLPFTVIHCYLHASSIPFLA